MSINKKVWEDLAELYPNKATWAKALSWLEDEQHEELMSALIDLTPEEIIKLIEARPIQVEYCNPPKETIVNVNATTIDEEQLVYLINKEFPSRRV